MATTAANGTPQLPALEIVPACREADTYPQNLHRGPDSNRTRRSLREQLEHRQKDLFNPNSGYGWALLETSNGKGYDPEVTCNDLAELQAHLSSRRPDPHCRVVFIQSEHSDAPLDGSKDMLTYLLSYHDVMPRFLRLLSLWGRRQPVIPSDQHCYHAAEFHFENLLDSRLPRRQEIPELGRSGRQTRLCYNLWGLETADNCSGRKPTDWRFRQTTLYHSFDVETGNTVWINLKANEDMRTRIAEAIEEQATPATAATTPEVECASVAFANALDLHLVAAEWCSENWGLYIRSVEDEVRGVVQRLENLPIGEVEKMLEVDSRALLDVCAAPGKRMPESPSLPRATYSFPISRTGTSEQPSASEKPLTAARRAFSGLSLKSLGRRQPEPDAKNEQEPQDVFRVLGDFNFKGLQKLNGLASRLQQANHTMKLDAGILSELDAHYRSLWEQDDLPASIKDGCRHKMQEFHQRMGTCIKTLEMERARLAKLVVAAEDVKRLFDYATQLRHTGTDRLFAAAAHEMAREMQKVAEKTEKETTSMHIITLVTLVFLPGTFVAVSWFIFQLVAAAFSAGAERDPSLTNTDSQTFFGSGLFQWDDNDPEMELPKWRPEFFKLFSLICFPLMAGTILVWLLVFRIAKQRGRRAADNRLVDDMAQSEV